MMKKCCVVFLMLATAGGVWNWTRVVAASEKIRDTWIESQKSQTLEDWDLHYRRGIRQLQKQAAELRQKSRNQSLSAEATRIRLERFNRRIVDSQQVVDSFSAQMKSAQRSGFTFAGQQYDESLASVQARRFSIEHKALLTQKAALEARVKHHGHSAARYAKAAQGLEKRLRKLEIRGQELMLRRRVLETQRMLKEIEKQRVELHREGCKPLADLQTLFGTAEEALDREEARQRILEKKEPARTLSLEEAAGQIPAEENGVY